MSFDASDWVWQHSKAEGIEKLILLAIAREADEFGMAWPTVQQIAERCGCDGRTVQRALCAAIAREELKRVFCPGGNHSNIYRFTAAPKCSPEGVAESHPRQESVTPSPLSPLPHSPSLLESALPERTKDAHDARETAVERKAEDLVLRADEQNGSARKKEAKPKSFERFRTFCIRNDLTEADIRFLWCGWEANGWMNGRHRIKSWKDAVIRQRDGDYVPSHRNGASNGRKH